MIEFGRFFGSFTGMRILVVPLCGFVLLMTGCGGGEPPPEMSTTKIVRIKGPPQAQTNTTQTATNKPVNLNTLRFVRRTNITTVVTSVATHTATNVLSVYYKDKTHYDKKEGFTGKTVMISTNGTQSLITLKHGLRHGVCKFNYPSGKIKYRVNYRDGLKNGRTLGWYETGKRRSKTFYTNNFRIGPWFTYHPNGMTNTVVVYSTKRIGTILRRAAFDPNGKPLSARTFPWEVGGTDTNKQITIYRGQPTTVVVRGFGDPDRKIGNLWVYNRLHIRDMKARIIRHTVQFTVQNNMVTAVEVLP